MLDNELMNSATFSPAVKTGALTMLADGNTLHAVSDVFGVPVDVLAAWEQEHIALPDDKPHRANIRRRRIATANSVNQGGKFIGRSVAIFAAGLSILLFFFSLFLPAFGQWPGIWALSLGWFEMARTATRRALCSPGMGGESADPRLLGNTSYRRVSHRVDAIRRRVHLGRRILVWCGGLSFRKR